MQAIQCARCLAASVTVNLFPWTMSSRLSNHIPNPNANHKPSLTPLVTLTPTLNPKIWLVSWLPSPWNKLIGSWTLTAAYFLGDKFLHISISSSTININEKWATSHLIIDCGLHGLTLLETLINFPHYLRQRNQILTRTTSRLLLRISRLQPETPTDIF